MPHIHDFTANVNYNRNVISNKYTKNSNILYLIVLLSAMNAFIQRNKYMLSTLTLHEQFDK